MLPAPAALEAVATIEALVGYPMPPLLKRLYLEVSNGHFDNDASIFPLTTPAGQDDRGWEPESVMDTCPAGSRPAVPASVVSLRYWGCQVFTHVDWSTPEGRIWGR